MARRIHTTDRLPRAYEPGDVRYERNARIGAVRERKAKAEAEAAQAALAAQQETAEAEDVLLTVGPSFPEGPEDGHLHVRTDLGELFAFDGTREKWLSVRAESVTFTNGTTLTAGNNLRLFQGPAGSGTLGWRLPWDATLVEVVASRATSGADTDYDIRAGTTVRHQHTLGSAATTSNEVAIDEDFVADEVVNVILGSDMTGGGTVTTIFRRRAS